jgi:5-methylcytosine-specific restriction endonuclease McrA
MKTKDKNGQLRGTRKFKGSQMIKCDICGKEFKHFLCETNRKYCSQTCYQKSPTRGKRPQNRRTEVCEWCSKEFTRPVANFKAKSHNFCSHSCSANWWAEYGLHGKDNPNWMGGYSQKVYQDGWSRIKKEIRIRANNVCEICGKKHKLMDVHHLIPIRIESDIKIANHFDNLQYLCRPCHIEADRFLRGKYPHQT